MADFKYFADLNGQPVELSRVYHDGAFSSAAHHFLGLGPDGSKLQAIRKIEYKSRPSRHECDDRCVHAKGRVMKCECACGGKNHGRGA